jgi:hypothetical protein
MVMAGMKKKRVQKATLKNDWRLASPAKKISDPYSQVKNPLKPRKRTSRIYAMRESKKEASSRLAMTQTGDIRY